MNAEILIVDDETDIRNLVKGILEDEGYKILTAANAAETYAHIAKRMPDLIVLDIWLEGSEHDGLKILETVKAKEAHLPVIMISGHGTIETAVSAIKSGAYDFIEKPFKSDRLLLMIQRALEAASLKRENEALRLKTETTYEFVGSSSAIQNLQQTLKRVAQTNSRVLLSGEPGCGKDLAARVIHKNSQRAEKPFLAINCASMHPERLEEELFGTKDSAGLLEKADGGTLLLDEVSDMPLETQGKIVRVLQEQKFHKIGDNKFIEVDVRIIASTSRDLEAKTKDGSFRQDLFYRLNVVPVELPSLRKHLADIAELSAYFAGIISRQTGLAVRNFSESAIAALRKYEWPGNVRQLRNVIESVMIMNNNAPGEDIGVAQLPPEISGNAAAGSISTQGAEMMIELPLREAREVFEKYYLESQIQRFDGNISKTAQFVGMERSALHRKLKSLQVAGTDKQDDESVDVPGDAKGEKKRA